MRHVILLVAGLVGGLAMLVVFFYETYMKPAYLYIGDSGAESDTLLVNCTEYEAQHAVGPHDGMSWHLARVGYVETHEGCEAILLDHDLADHYGQLPMAERIPTEDGVDTWGVRAWADDGGHAWRHWRDVPDSARGSARQIWQYHWAEDGDHRP